MSLRETGDYYGILGLPSSATASDIHKAYWRQASHCHPDKGGNHEAMVRVVEAWKILSDPYKRSRYDQLVSFQLGGWRSRKSNQNFRNFHRRAKPHSPGSWAEFETIYQKAAHTFNQDFYDDESDNTVPMETGQTNQEKKISAHMRVENSIQCPGTMGAMDYTKSVILFFAMLAMFLFHFNFNSIQRYVPIAQQAGPALYILDTTNGAIYPIFKTGQVPQNLSR
jgi:curved DNA-binding protein CbpA